MGHPEVLRNLWAPFAESKVAWDALGAKVLTMEEEAAAAVVFHAGVTSQLSPGQFRKRDPTKDASFTPVPSRENSNVGFSSGWMKTWHQVREGFGWTRQGDSRHDALLVLLHTV